MEQQYAGVMGVGLIAGLVEVAKRAGMHSAWSPLLALLLGLMLSVGYQAVAVASTNQEWMNSVIVGLGMGLAASGLYSGVKNTAEKL